MMGRKHETQGGPKGRISEKSFWGGLGGLQ